MSRSLLHTTAETWTLTKASKKLLEVFEMWTLQRMLNNSWTETITLRIDLLRLYIFYNATFQTVLFIIHFFCSQFNFPVNNFSLSMNNVLQIAILAPVSLAYPSSDIQLTKHFRALDVVFSFFSLHFPAFMNSSCFINCSGEFGQIYSVTALQDRDKLMRL